MKSAASRSHLIRQMNRLVITDKLDLPIRCDMDLRDAAMRRTHCRTGLRCNAERPACEITNQVPVRDQNVDPVFSICGPNVLCKCLFGLIPEVCNKVDAIQVWNLTQQVVCPDDDLGIL